uniref:Uncharacterized protein n=1 Tax=Ananas comosus var. bracteatus TaxID=296719 RepID=A0A6V7Q8R9_ANACO|nr:unnamed protein product [Ananas comosus var. bracteatus]
MLLLRPLSPTPTNGPQLDSTTGAMRPSIGRFVTNRSPFPTPRFAERLGRLWDEPVDLSIGRSLHCSPVYCLITKGGSSLVPPAVLFISLQLKGWQRKIKVLNFCFFCYWFLYFLKLDLQLKDINYDESIFHQNLYNELSTNHAVLFACYNNLLKEYNFLKLKNAMAETDAPVG